MAEIRGVVQDVIYTNEQTGYSVLELETEGSLSLVVTGNIPLPGNGEVIEAEGELVSHPVYGQQFKARRVTRSFPEEANDLLLYLSSGVIKGVGLTTARRIVTAFGAEALSVIENDPEKLSEVKGITPKKAQEIGEAFQRLAGLRSLGDFLSGSGLDAAISMALLHRFGNEALSRVLSDPYLLVTLGLTGNFEAVDRLAEKQGIPRTSPRRIDAGLLFTLSRAEENGHVCLPESVLLSTAASRLSLDEGDAAGALARLTDAGQLISVPSDGENYIYLPRLYRAERHVAEKIASLARVRYKVPKGLMLLIEKAAAELLVSYTEKQTEALRVAAENGAMILTGGPGTGKTTAIRGMIAMLEGLGCEVALAAPTGRAAKRMSELCHREAKTIHRLLEVTVDPRGEMIFNRGVLNPLAADAVILDELSMVDVELMSSLLAALKEGARLILVGDADQLPSVGAGTVLESLLESGVLPSVRLDEIFRQARESKIIVGAHEVRNGRIPPLREKSGDLFFLPRRTSREMADTVVDLVVNRLPDRLSIMPEDIQILLPNRRGAGGTEELNPLLQEALNPRGHGKREVRGRFSVFREGDRVMQTANNYEIEWRKNDTSEHGTGIFNGDVGVILSIDNDGGNMVIRFDERTAVYRFELLDQIELAYAVTVHKSQGSEYPAVIFGATLSRSRLLNRSLFYTAMTRAKKLLILVGRPESIEEMVANARPAARWSLLSRFLAEESGKYLMR